MCIYFILFPTTATYKLNHYSTGEAKDSVKLLGDLCARFVSVKNIDGRDWLVLSAQPVALAEVKGTIRDELSRLAEPTSCHSV